MNWCQLFGCYFPADRRFSLGLPDHPSDCSSPFMVLSPLAFPPWRCARRCTRIVPCELAMALADRVLLCLGCACSNRTAIAGNFRSQRSDENFALERVCRFVSRLLLGHSFGASPAPSGTRSSASHSAPLWVTVPPKTSLQSKERHANFFRAPPRKQTFDLGSRAHSLSSAWCDPINNGKIQQTETPSCTRTK
jgi:hypothetical protein